VISETRQAALVLLAEVWELAPDLRFGQLLSHLGLLGEDLVGHGLGDIEDDQFMAVMLHHRAELQARLEGRPSLLQQLQGLGLSVSGSPTAPEAAPAAKQGR
jgi:hypothetical protein